MKRRLAALTTAARSGGFTINPVSLDPIEAGYAVGGICQAIVIPSTVFHSDHVKLALIAFGAEFQYTVGPARALGAWLDAGYVHLEPVTVLADKSSALQLGRACDEKAIGDLAAYARGKDGTIPVPQEENES